jgi:hypothetical protein
MDKVALIFLVDVTWVQVSKAMVETFRCDKITCIQASGKGSDELYLTQQ